MLEILLDDVDSEFQANDKHVEGQAQLRCRKQIRGGVSGFLGWIPRENAGLPFGGQQTEDAWSQANARDHLGDHLRLAKSFRDDSHDATSGQNDGDLEKELDGEIEVIHGVSG